MYTIRIGMIRIIIIWFIYIIYIYFLICSLHSWQFVLSVLFSILFLLQPALLPCILNNHRRRRVKTFVPLNGRISIIFNDHLPTHSFSTLIKIIGCARFVYIRRQSYPNRKDPLSAVGAHNYFFTTIYWLTKLTSNFQVRDIEWWCCYSVQKYKFSQCVVLL